MNGSLTNTKGFYGLNYIEHLLILTSGDTRCVSVSAFASLVGIPISIENSAVGLKVFAITAGIKIYKSILRKRKRSMIKSYY